MYSKKQVCTWLKQRHKQGKEYTKKNIKLKNITIKLFKEQNKQVSSILIIDCNVKTENIHLLHALYYSGNRFYLTRSKNEELKCVNKHTTEQYEKHRKRDIHHKRNGYKKQYYNRKKKYLGIIKICKNLTSEILAEYNIDTNDISIVTNILYKNKRIKIGRMK